MSRDPAIALQPGQQSETVSKEKLPAQMASLKNFTKRFRKRYQFYTNSSRKQKQEHLSKVILTSSAVTFYFCLLKIFQSIFLFSPQEMFK